MASSHHIERRKRPGLLRWILLAAVVHLEALLVVGVVMYFHAPRNTDLLAARAKAETGDDNRIAIDTVDEETARRILAEMEREEEKAKEELVKKETESSETPGQVVELPKPKEEKRPESAKFAAEHDSTVEKESKKLGRFDEKSRQGDRAGDAETTTPANPAAPAQAAQPPRPAAPGALAMRTPGTTAKPGSPSRAPAAGARGAEAGAEDAEPAPSDPEGVLPQGGRLVLRPLGEIGQPGGAMAPSPPTPPSSALVPSREQVARAIGGGTEDYLKDIDDGDETMLNAKKWKYASFFNRVKQQVREHWKPADVYRRRDPTGAIYGSKDRYTLLRVQLKPDGTLANVSIEQPSGIEFLDDEAIESFKSAQPFPNPPKQLVEQTSGLIQFRFGFFFEISGAPKFKIFRYNSM